MLCNLCVRLKTVHLRWIRWICANFVVVSIYRFENNSWMKYANNKYGLGGMVKIYQQQQKTTAADKRKKLASTHSKLSPWYIHKQTTHAWQWQWMKDMRQHRHRSHHQNRLFSQYWNARVFRYTLYSFTQSIYENLRWIRVSGTHFPSHIRGIVAKLRCIHLSRNAWETSRLFHWMVYFRQRWLPLESNQPTG